MLLSTPAVAVNNMKAVSLRVEDCNSYISSCSISNNSSSSRDSKGACSRYNSSGSSGSPCYRLWCSILYVRGNVMVDVPFPSVHEPRTNAIHYNFLPHARSRCPLPAPSHHAHIEIYDHMHIILPHHLKTAKNNCQDRGSNPGISR